MVRPRRGGASRRCIRHDLACPWAGGSTPVEWVAPVNALVHQVEIADGGPAPVPRVYDPVREGCRAPTARDRADGVGIYAADSTATTDPVIDPAVTRLVEEHDAANRTTEENR